MLFRSQNRLLMADTTRVQDAPAAETTPAPVEPSEEKKQGSVSTQQQSQSPTSEQRPPSSTNNSRPNRPTSPIGSRHCGLLSPRSCRGRSLSSYARGRDTRCPLRVEFGLIEPGDRHPSAKWAQAFGESVSLTNSGVQKGGIRLQFDGACIEFAGIIAQYFDRFGMADARRMRTASVRWRAAKYANSSTTFDLLPFLPSFMRRVCSGYAPLWGGLRTPLV